MTGKLISPIWRDAPVEVQRWMETVTKVLTGRVEGGTPIVVDGAAISAAIAAAPEISALTMNVQTTAAAAAGSNLYATASRASIFAAGPAYGVLTTGPVTVTPFGGTGPYTHSWTLVSGDSNAAPDSLTADTVSFEASIPAAGQSEFAIWRDTVQDSLGATYTVDIPITISGRFDRQFAGVGVTP